MGFVANFIRFPAVQKFCKSVKIWQSYREFKSGNFFETQCIYKSLFLIFRILNIIFLDIYMYVYKVVIALNMNVKWPAEPERPR